MFTVKQWLVLTAATMAVPASRDHQHPPDQILVGVGMLVVLQVGGSWTFRRRAIAIPAGVPESRLVTRLSKLLLSSATLIGWNVEDNLLPVLSAAAAAAPPDTARNAMVRLHRLLRNGVVDLAARSTIPNPQTFAEIASDMAIYAPAWDPDSVFNAWATGRSTTLRRDLADEAVALWLAFVRRAGFGGLEAEEATNIWVAGQRERGVAWPASGSS